MGTGGSVYLAGYTEGDWNQLNLGETDFAVTKLSADGNLVWRWQVFSAVTETEWNAKNSRVQ